MNLRPPVFVACTEPVRPPLHPHLVGTGRDQLPSMTTRPAMPLPKNSPDALLPEVIVEMSRKGIGMTAIVDAADKLLGIFTDGDLRRTLEKHDMIKKLRVGDVQLAKAFAAGGDA